MCWTDCFDGDISMFRWKYLCFDGYIYIYIYIYNIYIYYIYIYIYIYIYK